MADGAHILHPLVAAEDVMQESRLLVTHTTVTSALMSPVPCICLAAALHLCCGPALHA